MHSPDTDLRAFILGAALSKHTAPLARVVKLVDTLGLESGGRKAVGVQVPPRAPVASLGSLIGNGGGLKIPFL